MPIAALALPTAVNENVFTGEIVYKTDIGEKSIESYPHWAMAIKY